MDTSVPVWAKDILDKLSAIEMRLGMVKNDMTVDQAAAELGRSIWTIRQMCNRGEAPGAYKIEGRSHGEWRIPLSTLEALREALKTTGKPQRLRPAS